MKPPMRRPDPIRCATCGEHITGTDYGWRHVRRLRITDPDWHPARPA